MPPMIQAQHLSLAYRLDRNPAGTFKQFIINLFKGQVHHDTLWALRDVSFQVEKGEILGVIGPNGAGKSTLMKILARVLPPTEGRVIVRGTVAPMISLGAGFNPELTARENIILYGTLLGHDARLMANRVRPIIEWAELGGFIDVPTRSFSTGMITRLAFSVATDTPADVLIVDEVLAVGDEAFRKKSEWRMQSLIEQGSSVILVSHTLPSVVNLTDRVMWLEHGAIVKLGDPEEVVSAYRESTERS